VVPWWAEGIPPPALPVRIVFEGVQLSLEVTLRPPQGPSPSVEAHYEQRQHSLDQIEAALSEQLPTLLHPHSQLRAQGRMPGLPLTLSNVPFGSKVNTGRGVSMSAKLYQELGFQASKSQGRIVPAKFPVLFPVGRDFRCRDRFDSDCVRHHAVP
jgi:hypothetical protein